MEADAGTPTKEKAVGVARKENITNCPECNDALKPFTNFLGMPFTLGYCPRDNFIRMRKGMAIYMCKDCDSISYYNQHQEERDILTGKLVDALEKKVDVEGKITKESIVGEIAGMNKALNKLKDTCWFCGSDEMEHISRETFEKREERGLRAGWRLSQVYIDDQGKHRRGRDHTPGDTVTKVNQSVCKTECVECGDSLYFSAPGWVARTIGVGGQVDTQTVVAGGPTIVSTEMKRDF